MNANATTACSINKLVIVLALVAIIGLSSQPALAKQGKERSRQSSKQRGNPSARKSGHANMPHANRNDMTPRFGTTHETPSVLPHVNPKKNYPRRGRSVIGPDIRDDAGNGGRFEMPDTSNADLYIRFGIHGGKHTEQVPGSVNEVITGTGPGGGPHLQSSNSIRNRPRSLTGLDQETDEMITWGKSSLGERHTASGAPAWTTNTHGHNDGWFGSVDDNPELVTSYGLRGRKDMERVPGAGNKAIIGLGHIWPQSINSNRNQPRSLTGQDQETGEMITWGQSGFGASFDCHTRPHADGIK